MKHLKLKVLYFLSFLILVSFSEMTAYGSAHSIEQTAISCDAKNTSKENHGASTNKSSKSKCCSEKGDSKSCCKDGSCDGDCSHPGCKCPGQCTSISNCACNFSNSEFSICCAESGKNKTNFYFQAEKMTEVYLSIWTPPNINI